MAREIVKIPIPEKILSISVNIGSMIKEGEEICILESMKMENPLVSPVDGKVIEISVSPGQMVKGGDPLAIIEY